MLDVIYCCCPCLRSSLSSGTNNEQRQPFAGQGDTATTSYTQCPEGNSITRDSIVSVDDDDKRFQTIPLDDDSDE